MKYALLIGINYLQTSHKLKGCINDVNAMKKLLIEKYEYQDSNIMVLTDMTDQKPTRNNILYHMNHLVSRAKYGDYLCLYYSGHGTRVIDTNGDEESGFDDALYTLDDKMITDDEVLLQLKNVRSGINMSIFFDCCHSGTMADLTYNMMYKGTNFFRRPRFNNWTSPSVELDGNICMYSGCLDDQTSADARFRRTSNEFNDNNGAFTYCLLKVLESCDSITNKNLLIKINNSLDTHRFKQVPQLSCSNMKLLERNFIL